MARAILTLSLIVLVCTLVGCHGIDSGASQLIPARTKPVSGADISGVNESEMVEQIAMNRLAYRQYLETLITYYDRTGKTMQLGWAKRELEALDNVPQYNYIIEAIVAGPGLKASTSIAVADYMYSEALRTEQDARGLVIWVDENKLRLALDKYNQLIRQHPSSDKIDDAAYRAAGISEHFRDYTIALMYYQRTYQWNPDTTYPARYKAAYIMDAHLSRRSEALELYKQAVKNPTLGENYKEFAQMRIETLTQTDKVEK